MHTDLNDQVTFLHSQAFVCGEFIVAFFRLCTLTYLGSIYGCVELLNSLNEMSTVTFRDPLLDVLLY